MVEEKELTRGSTLAPPAPAERHRRPLIHWKGPLDAETVARFEQRVREQLAEPEEEVFFDLRRVDYIDSAGLRFFLALRERWSTCCRRIVLIVNGESRVERTMKLVGFDRLFDLVSRPVRRWRR